jgi:hypothetical protein
VHTEGTLASFMGRCPGPLPTLSWFLTDMAFAQFAFAMTDALVDQLVARFTATPWSPLSQGEVDAQIIQENRHARGVYLLGRAQTPNITTVYVGQSNSTLYDRLSRHAKFLQDRYGLPYESVRFKALGIIIFDSVALEERLMDVYETRWNRTDLLSGWNGSGIGSNDTGGGRDKQKPSGFDRRFPIDVTLNKAGLLVPGPTGARQLFTRIKSIAPYTIRLAPTTLIQHADFQTAQINITEADTSVLAGLQALLNQLPNLWSVQVSPVRVLMQHDASLPENVIVNPDQWPPAEWLEGEDRCVVFRSKEQEPPLSPS